MCSLVSVVKLAADWARADVSAHWHSFLARRPDCLLLVWTKSHSGWRKTPRCRGLANETVAGAAALRRVTGSEIGCSLPRDFAGLKSGGYPCRSARSTLPAQLSATRQARLGLPGCNRSSFLSLPCRGDLSPALRASPGVSNFAIGQPDSPVGGDLHAPATSLTQTARDELAHFNSPSGSAQGPGPTWPPASRGGVLGPQSMGGRSHRVATEG